MYEALAVKGMRHCLLSMITIGLIATGCGGGTGGSVGSGGGGGYNGGGGTGNGTGTTLSLESKTGIGTYLVSAEGRTLYYFALDVPASAAHAAVSNCTGGCLPIWPVFHAALPITGPGLNAADFGEFLRSDGVRQTTFKGWPLYYFSGDATAGDTNGDNLGEPRPTDLWFVIKDPFYAALVMTRSGGPTLYLADPTGRSLYVFADDTVGTASSDPVSACIDAVCLGAWPVFTARSGPLPTGLDPAKLTTFTRPDGRIQSAFDGHPLYYFSGDSGPGLTSGIDIDGFAIADPSAL